MRRFNRKRLKDDEFIMTFVKAVQKYGLYTEDDETQFNKDMRSLISHGFVEAVDESKGIYKFSDKWKQWKPGDDFYQKMAVTKM